MRAKLVNFVSFYSWLNKKNTVLQTFITISKRDFLVIIANSTTETHCKQYLGLKTKCQMLFEWKRQSHNLNFSHKR